jgi:hypothetical protein
LINATVGFEVASLTTKVDLAPPNALMAGRIYEEEPGRPISGYAAQAVVELRRITANFANDHPRPRLGLGNISE